MLIPLLANALVYIAFGDIYDLLEWPWLSSSGRRRSVSSHMACGLLIHPLICTASSTTVCDEQFPRLPRSSNLPYKMTQVESGWRLIES